MHIDKAKKVSQLLQKINELENKIEIVKNMSPYKLFLDTKVGLRIEIPRQIESIIYELVLGTYMENLTDSLSELEKL